MDNGNETLISLISLVEWAQRNNIDERNARRYAAAGRIPGARKIGRNWVVPKNAALINVRRHTPKNTSAVGRQ